MPICSACGNEILGDYYTCPTCGSNICVSCATTQGGQGWWPKCEKCGGVLRLRRAVRMNMIKSITVLVLTAVCAVAWLGLIFEGGLYSLYSGVPGVMVMNILLVIVLISMTFVAIRYFKLAIENIFSTLREYWPIALALGMFSLIVLYIFFSFFTVFGILGGVIGFLFCGVNQKYSLMKAANHWIFITAIVLVVFFAAVGTIVFSPLGYLAVGTMCFIIAYWLRLQVLAR